MLWHSLDPPKGALSAARLSSPPWVARGMWIALPVGKQGLSAGAGLAELACTWRYAAGVLQPGLVSA